MILDKSTLSRQPVVTSNGNKQFNLNFPEIDYVITNDSSTC